MGQRISISVDGVLAGTGDYDGDRISNCPAVLGDNPDSFAQDDIYTVIEDAIDAVGDEGSVDVEGVGSVGWTITDAD